MKNGEGAFKRTTERLVRPAIDDDDDPEIARTLVLDTYDNGVLQLTSYDWLGGPLRRHRNGLEEMTQNGSAERPLAEFGLDWERMSSLERDVQVAGLFQSLGDQYLDIHSAEEERPEIWDEIDARLTDKFGSRGSVLLSQLRVLALERGWSFTVALWAQLCTEPLGDVWLATAAQDAFFRRNDFALGYLMAMLDHRRHAESNFLKGKKVSEGASQGGRHRAKKGETERIVSEIRRLRSERRLSIARAADLAAAHGIGRSGLANQQRWYRHHRKKY